MSIPLTLQRAEAASLPLLKNLLASENLPTEDLNADMQLFYSLAGSPNDQEILTCGGYEQYGNIGLLRSVAIHPKNQGKGIGKQWMRLLLEKGQELGLEEIYLLTTTAEGFFQKIGFTTIPRENVPAAIQNSEEFSSICPSSAALMRFKF